MRENDMIVVLRYATLLLCLLVACGSSEKTNNGGVRPADTLRGIDPGRFDGDAIRSDTSTAIITLERTACFGACPIYTVALYDDGIVIFNGLRFVDELGLRIRDIGSAPIEDLVGHARRISYTSLDERYEGSATEPTPTDLPTTITSVRFGGFHKVVRNYWGAPPQLREFERRIDSIVGTTRWIGGGGHDPVGK